LECRIRPVQMRPFLPALNYDQPGTLRPGDLLVLPFGPSPSSRLFPYTTLFRSALQDSLKRVREGIVDPVASNGNVDSASNTLPLDRKSTRLNSSHVKISYAVFCLKKKK